MKSHKITRRATIVGGVATATTPAAARDMFRPPGRGATSSATLPSIESVTIGGVGNGGSLGYPANTGNAVIGVVNVATSDNSVANVTITGTGSVGFHPLTGTSGLTLEAPSGGVAAGSHNVTVAASGSYSNSPHSITVTLIADRVSMTVNGSTVPATVVTGDDVWVNVTGVPSGKASYVQLVSSSNQQFHQAGPTSDLSFGAKIPLTGQNQFGQYAPLPAGWYEVQLLYSGSLTVILSVPSAVTATNSVPPFTNTLGPALYNNINQFEILINGTPQSNILAQSPQAYAVKGIVNFSGQWASLGGIGPSVNVTLQFTLFGPGQPVGGSLIGRPVFDANGFPSYSGFDTTTLADGTYMVSALIIDANDTLHGLSPYQIIPYPCSMIVMNTGPQPITSTNLKIPNASRNINAHNSSTGIDFVTYNGIPQPDTLYAYPDIGTIPPVYSSASPYNPANGGDPTALRAFLYWGGGITGMRYFEYTMGYAFQTTTAGGIFAGRWNSELVNGDETIEGSYATVARQSYKDSWRPANQVIGNSTQITVPATGPFAAYHWMSIQIDGGIAVINFAGEKLTIAGPRADPSKLQIDSDVSQYFPATINPFPNTLQVGNISTNPANTFPDFGGSANDGAWDPRNPNILDVCLPLYHCIIVCDFTVQTIGGANYGPTAGPGGTPRPYCYRYAGYANGVSGNGNGGYVDGPALGSVTGGGQNGDGAQFNGPYSIAVQLRTDQSDPQGTMYVADHYNCLIRKILPTSTPGIAGSVSTVVGNQPGIPVAGSGVNGAAGQPALILAAVTETLSVSSYNNNGNGTIAVTLATTPTITPALGWKGYLIVDGSVYRTSSSEIEPSEGIYTITAFTSPTQFSVNAPYPGAGHTLTFINQAADKYSAPGTVSFANAYTICPQIVRVTSSGNLVIMEAWYNSMARYIDLTAQTIRRIGPTGNNAQTQNPDLSDPTHPTTGNALSDGWAWGDVDIGNGTLGACGPLDDIVMFKMDSNPGSAATAWRWSLDGTYNGQWPGQQAFNFPAEGQPGVGHYPWDFVFSRTQFRMLSAGRGMNGFTSWRPYRPGVDPDGAIDKAVWPEYEYDAPWPWSTGTASVFPLLLRPSFKALYGESGEHWWGSQTLPNIDHLPGLYPTASQMISFLQGGAGGSIPRPEFSVDASGAPGRDLARAMYFVNRQSMAGSFPTQYPPLFIAGDGFGGAGVLATPGTWSTDCIRPNIGNVTINRVDHFTITATYNTDKPTMGILCAASPYSYKKNGYPYCRWSNPESTHSTGPRTLTIGNLPDSSVSGNSPTHINILVIDLSGNWNCIADQEVT